MSHTKEYIESLEEQGYSPFNDNPNFEIAENLDFIYQQKLAEQEQEEFELKTELEISSSEISTQNCNTL